MIVIGASILLINKEKHEADYKPTGSENNLFSLPAGFIIRRRGRRGRR